MKCSLIFFYMRVFPGRTSRNASYGALAFTIVPSLTLTFLTIFSCRPVQMFWDKDIKTGSCLDVTALAYVNSGFAVAQDLVILVLPLAMLPKLQVKFARKIGVAIMILLGSFGWITTIIRLQVLSVFGQSVDPTWDYVPVANWTAVELATGVVCGCLPAIRSLLARYFPHVPLLASEHSSSSSSGARKHLGSSEEHSSNRPANTRLPSHMHYTEISGGISGKTQYSRS